MTMEDHRSKELGHINASGFPLQIALGHAVEKTRDQHDWSVRYQEHAWRHDEAAEGGFIDLVLDTGFLNLVVECKRLRDIVWTFLIEGESVQSRRHAKCFVRNQHGTQVVNFEWIDATLDPRTFQSQFCVIPGTDNRSRSLIERTAAELILATEALADEDRRLARQGRKNAALYFPVIVTTATLRVCRFDPAKISLADGTLPEGTFEDVPYVRFRKQLKTHFEVSEDGEVVRAFEVARAKENTVFVVNAEHLIDFLREFDLTDNQHVLTILR